MLLTTPHFIPIPYSVVYEQEFNLSISETTLTKILFKCDSDTWFRRELGKYF